MNIYAAILKYCFIKKEKAKVIDKFARFKNKESQDAIKQIIRSLLKQSLIRKYKSGGITMLVTTETGIETQKTIRNSANTRRDLH